MSEQEVEDGKKTENSYDYLFKIILAGPAGGGKTTMLTRLTKGEFVEQYVTTIGVDFAVKSGSVSKTNFKLQIWDTAGNERFRNITTAYFRGAHAVLVVADVTGKNAIEDVKTHLTAAKQHGHSDLISFIVGTKTDLPERTVSAEEMQALATANDCEYLEVSSKTGQNVNSLFSNVVQKMLKIKGVQCGAWWHKPTVNWADQK